MNVVTLLPSATEVVYALGIEPVGVSHECDYPPAATELPSMNRSRVDPEASSAAINEQVVEAERGDGVYEIDVAALDAADPDLVVTQGICDVCAVDEILVERAVEEIDANPEILASDPHSLADLYDDVRRVGEATGRTERAAELVDSLQSRVAAVEARAAETAERPRVAVLDWMEPPMVAGHWVPELVEIAGGEYGLAERGERSRPREFTEVAAYDPEVLVAAPCGFGLDRTTANAAELTDRDEWDEVTAVREGRAYAMDGNHYMNRPGPRLVDTLEHLAGLLHPEAFDRPPADVATAFPAAAPRR
ncbi:ABC transporter substrate-binding protein [Halostella salina]|uniref:ABC transporter substrate-binding protein n=1 Tax=Halostella salina TaxID=1547897 RepID=UPI000EF7EDD6|nr:ABC transporter substrate-binding protein [Halostella salina]